MISILLMFSLVAHSPKTVPSLTIDEKIKILKGEEKYLRELIPAKVSFLYSIDTVYNTSIPTMLIQIRGCNKICTTELHQWMRMVKTELDARVTYMFFL